MSKFSESLGVWLSGLIHRAYFWLFALLLDPLDIYNRYLRPTGWPEYNVSTAVFFYVLGGLILWTSFLTYHDLRSRLGSGELEPNMPLHEACRWIARDSVWAEAYPRSRDREWASEVHDEIMSKLLMGRIEMFGRKREPQHLKGPMQYVTGADKSRVEWDYRKLASMDEPPTHMWVPGGGAAYYAVKLDAKQVRRVWPKRSVLARIMKRSPVERVDGLNAAFARQDAYYRDKLGEAPTMSAILEGSK